MISTRVKKFSLVALIGAFFLGPSPEVFGGLKKRDAQVVSFDKNVTCSTVSLKFEMIPRAPRMGVKGERVKTYSQSNKWFIKGKVDVLVREVNTGTLLDSFVVVDNTDPWEIAWPMFGLSDRFKFYSQSSGQPIRLVYRGWNLENHAKCTF